MKKIISIAAVCIFFTLNLFAQENPLLRQLLDLPAPPPVATDGRNRRKKRPTAGIL